MIRTTTSSAPPFTRWSSDGMQKVIGAQVIGAQTQNTQSSEELLVDSHSCPEAGNATAVERIAGKRILHQIVTHHRQQPDLVSGSKGCRSMDDLVKAAEREVEMEAA